MAQEAVLLAADDSLASHASLVSMAVYPTGQPIPQNVTTLVMSNTTALDETVAASLMPATPDYSNTTYRVRKLHPSSMDDVSIVGFIASVLCSITDPLCYSYPNHTYLSLFILNTLAVHNFILTTLGGDAVVLLVMDLQFTGSNPVCTPLRSGFGQASYTGVPLSPNSVICYQPRGSYALWLTR